MYLFVNKTELLELNWIETYTTYFNGRYYLPMVGTTIGIDDITW